MDGLELSAIPTTSLIGAKLKCSPDLRALAIGVWSQPAQPGACR